MPRSKDSLVETDSEFERESVAGVDEANFVVSDNDDIEEVPETIEWTVENIVKKRWSHKEKDWMWRVEWEPSPKCQQTAYHNGTDVPVHDCKCPIVPWDKTWERQYEDVMGEKPRVLWSDALSEWVWTDPEDKELFERKKRLMETRRKRLERDQKLMKADMERDKKVRKGEEAKKGWVSSDEEDEKEKKVRKRGRVGGDQEDETEKRVRKGEKEKRVVVTSDEEDEMERPKAKAKKVPRQISSDDEDEPRRGKAKKDKMRAVWVLSGEEDETERRKAKPQKVRRQSSSDDEEELRRWKAKQDKIQAQRRESHAKGDVNRDKNRSVKSQATDRQPLAPERRQSVGNKDREERKYDDKQVREKKKGSKEKKRPETGRDGRDINARPKSGTKDGTDRGVNNVRKVPANSEASGGGGVGKDGIQKPSERPQLADNEGKMQQGPEKACDLVDESSEAIVLMYQCKWGTCRQWCDSNESLGQHLLNVHFGGRRV
ncbi:hypothetical protein HK104_005568 [Borealophlyctis nickersoniae]|nr:hypothetical protein HK104_005568 [Borealophlyctis nickersoniae]